MRPGRYWRAAHQHDSHGSEWECIGHCSVETGLIMIGDPCDPIMPDPPECFSSWDAFNDTLNWEMIEQNGGQQLGQAGSVVVTSGIGDGIYDVYVQRDDDGRVIAAQIRFDGIDP